MMRLVACMKGLVDMFIVSPFWHPTRLSQTDRQTRRQRRNCCINIENIFIN